MAGIWSWYSENRICFHLNCCPRNGQMILMWAVMHHVIAGSHGFCGGRGPESSPDLLVHSEIRERESSASILWTYLSMILHGSEGRWQNGLQGEKYCVAACFGVTGEHATKDLLGMVKHNSDWIQRNSWLSDHRRLWVDRFDRLIRQLSA